MQPCLHRFAPQSEQIGCLVDAHFLDQPRHQDDAKRFGQRVDGLLEKSTDFVIGQRAFGVGLRGGEGKAMMDSAASTLFHSIVRRRRRSRP